MLPAKQRSSYNFRFERTLGARILKRISSSASEMELSCWRDRKSISVRQTGKTGWLELLPGPNRANWQSSRQ